MTYYVYDVRADNAVFSGSLSECKDYINASVGVFEIRGGL
jgi:hypothetical protein